MCAARFCANLLWYTLYADVLILFQCGNDDDEILRLCKDILFVSAEKELNFYYLLSWPLVCMITFPPSSSVSLCTHKAAIDMCVCVCVCVCVCDRDAHVV